LAHWQAKRAAVPRGYQPQPDPGVLWWQLPHPEPTKATSTAGNPTPADEGDGKTGGGPPLKPSF
jgi:hypothetical protein